MRIVVTWQRRTPIRQLPPDQSSPEQSLPDQPGRARLSQARLSQARLARLSQARGSRRARLLLAFAVLALAGCGTVAAGPGPGTAASLQLSLKTVPTVRSITVSPAKATFANCEGGLPSLNTRSTSTRLGFPNGTCWVGSWKQVGIYPIKITNTGIASLIKVNGSNADPSDDGNGWSLCNRGGHPAVACTGRDKRMPGVDQYFVQNFSPADSGRSSGLTNSPVCDGAFSQRGRCWATQGQSQTEAFELIGPTIPTDYNATNWTLTITWTPVPS